MIKGGHGEFMTLIGAHEMHTYRHVLCIQCTVDAGF